MSEQATVAADGRRARRDRNREAVVDAVYELLSEGVAAPGAEQIAQRAGVSVSSVFRYFDGLDDLHEQTIAHHFALHAEHFELPDLGHGSLPERIEHLVSARLDLYEQIAPIARVARSRALDHERIGAELATTRHQLGDQIRAHFAPELAPLDAPAVADAVALVDVLTSFEAWELLRSVHDAGREDVRRAWTRGLDALLAPR